MATWHAPNAPNAVELRARIRGWLRYYFRKSGLKSQRELAQAMGFSEVTISNLLRDLEDPGLDCFVRLHFLSGESMALMVREDAPKSTEEPVRARPKARAKKMA